VVDTEMAVQLLVQTPTVTPHCPVEQMTVTWILMLILTTLKTATLFVVTMPGAKVDGQVTSATVGVEGVETSSAPQKPVVGSTKHVYKKQFPLAGL